MLNDLRRPAGERFNARLELLILPLHLDGLKPLRFPRAGQGQAALLRVIRRGFFDDHGIEHDHVCTNVVERDDALVDANHIRRHAHAAILVRGERMHNLILKYEPATSELYKAANAIKAVNDSHQWLYRIHEQTGLSESEIVHDIFRVAASSDEMSEYIKDIEEYCQRQEELW